MEMLCISSIYDDYVINVSETYGSVDSIKGMVEEISGIVSSRQAYYYQGKEVWEYNTIEMDLLEPLQLVEKEYESPAIFAGAQPIRFLVKYEEETITIEISDEMTIGDLKKILRDKFFIPLREQRLFSNSEYIKEDERTLKSYGIKNSSWLELAESAPGGGGPGTLPINFNKLTNQIELEFSVFAPEWRRVSKGICFLGRCTNENCRAYNREVISCHGVGLFTMSKFIAQCPMKDCKKNIISENCGFYGVKWKFVGVKEDLEKIQGEGRARDDVFTTFKDGDNIIWRDLRFQVWHYD